MQLGRDVMAAHRVTRRLSVLLLVVMGGTLPGWAHGEPAASEISPEDLSLSVDRGEVLCKCFLGFGVHGDFFLTRSCNAERGVTERDLRLNRRRIESLRPHLVRTFFNYKWWEPEEGRQTPASEEMRDYVEWCRFLQSIGADVLLTPWGENFAYSEWMLPGEAFDSRFEPGSEKDVSVPSWSMAPKLPLPEKREATVRCLVDLVEHLRRVEGLTNVRYLCLMNEPDNDPARPVEAQEYIRLTRLLSDGLAARGLRDEVILLGPDDSGGPLDSVDPWFEETLSRAPQAFDALSSHTYAHRPKDLPQLSDFVRARREVLDRLGIDRPLMITEFGYGGSTFQNLENHKYEYGLYLPDFALTAVEAGAAAALTWCLLDTYYDRESRDTEHKQEYGLWKWLDEGWKPRPGFYSWSLLTRYTRPESRVYRVDLDPNEDAVTALAFVSPDGYTTVPVVNRGQKAYRVRLDPRVEGETVFRVYEFSEETVPTGDDGMVGAHDARRAVEGAAVEFDLPARSFVLLTDLP